MMEQKSVSVSTSTLVYGALVVLTVLTYVAALYDLRWGNTLVALVIAAAKAILILLFFMHMKYNTWLMWVVATAAVFWFGIMFVLTMTDYLTRAWGAYGL